jgi:hypothetical protein
MIAAFVSQAFVTFISLRSLAERRPPVPMDRPANVGRPAPGADPGG